VAIPKLRSGSYFPDWLLERRRRSEAALMSVVATCYLLGVSTRRKEKQRYPSRASAMTVATSGWAR
jgi:putative transposase